jgi:hypothetical protein
VTKGGIPFASAVSCDAGPRGINDQRLIGSRNSTHNERWRLVECEAEERGFKYIEVMLSNTSCWTLRILF